MNQFLENPWLDPIIDWLANVLTKQSIIASLILIALGEIGIPVLIPGDVIYSYLGLSVKHGTISYWESIVLILIVTCVGASILYYLSFYFGDKLLAKFSKLFHVNTEKFAKLEKDFDRYGALVIIFGRHFPGLGIPITIFAGISKFSYKVFILCVALTTFIWAIIYVNLGIKLGSKVNLLLRFSSHNSFTIGLLLVILLILFLYFEIRKR